MSKENVSATGPVLSPEEKLEIKNTRAYMFDMLLMLVAPIIMAWYYYGERAIRIVALSVLTAVACEFIGTKLVKTNAYISDLSAVVTGVAVALCTPAAAPLWLAPLATAFAIIVAKMPFGNARSVMFLPVAAGLAFVTICNEAQTFGYCAIPPADQGITLFGNADFVSGNSITYMLEQKNSIGINVLSYIDILVGNVPGAMGTTCAVAMLGALLFLILRRPKTSVISLSYLAVCAVYAFIFPRVTTGRLISVVMELTGGLLFFGAVFLVTNEIIAPKRFVAKICYGAVGGLIVMLLRSFGTYEDSTVFAILLVNAIAPVFDKELPLTKKEKQIIALKQAAEVDAVKLAEEEKANEQKNAEISQVVEKVKANILKKQTEENHFPTENVAPVESTPPQDDDVPTLQDLSDINVTEENENGGERNV